MKVNIEIILKPKFPDKNIARETSWRTISLGLNFADDSSVYRIFANLGMKSLSGDSIIVFTNQNGLKTKRDVESLLNTKKSDKERTNETIKIIRCWKFFLSNSCRAKKPKMPKIGMAE